MYLSRLIQKIFSHRGPLLSGGMYGNLTVRLVTVQIYSSQAA
jgi:hypothetical protein